MSHNCGLCVNTQKQSPDSNLQRSSAAWTASVLVSAAAQPARHGRKSPLGTEPWWSRWSDGREEQTWSRARGWRSSVCTNGSYAKCKYIRKSKTPKTIRMCLLSLTNSLKTPPSSWNLAATKSNSSIWCSPGEKSRNFELTKAKCSQIVTSQGHHLPVQTALPLHNTNVTISHHTIKVFGVRVSSKWSVDSRGHTARYPARHHGPH